MVNQGKVKRKYIELGECRIWQKQKLTTIEKKRILTNGRYKRVMTWSSPTGRCPLTVSQEAQTKRS